MSTAAAQLLLVAQLTCVAHLACAQQSSLGTPAPRSFPGPAFLHRDSLEAALRSSDVWRGIPLGSLPVSAAASYALWRIDGVQDRHAITARAAAVIPLRRRSAADRFDVYALDAGYRYRLDTQQGEADVGYVARSFRGATMARVSHEVGATIQRRVGIGAISEIRPLVGLQVAHDFADLDGTYVEPRFIFDVGLPPANNGATSMGARIEAHAGWSDYARSGGRSFHHQASALGLWLTADRASSRLGPLLAELGVEGWLSNAADADARFLVGSLRFVSR